MNEPLEEQIWDIVKNEAREKYYIETEDGIAEKPAFLIPSYSWTISKSRYELWMGHIGITYKSNTRKGVHEKLREICQKSKVPMKILRKVKDGWETIAEQS